MAFQHENVGKLVRSDSFEVNGQYVTVTTKELS